MTVRATTTEIGKVLEYEDGTFSPDAIALDAFINQANILTDWLSSVDTSSELSAACLTAIEVQLAAHFYRVQRDKDYQSKSANGASGSFEGQTGLALQATHYGQTAMLLDVTGKLTKRNLESQQGKRVATVTWLGWQDHSEDPYS